MVLLIAGHNDLYRKWGHFPKFFWLIRGWRSLIQTIVIRHLFGKIQSYTQLSPSLYHQIFHHSFVITIGLLKVLFCIMMWTVAPPEEKALYYIGIINTTLKNCTMSFTLYLCSLHKWISKKIAPLFVRGAYGIYNFWFAKQTFSVPIVSKISATCLAIDGHPSTCTTKGF